MRSIILCLFISSLVSACDDDDGNVVVDAGHDSGSLDSGTVDSGSSDSGTDANGASLGGIGSYCFPDAGQCEPTLYCNETSTLSSGYVCSRPCVAVDCEGTDCCPDGADCVSDYPAIGSDGGVEAPHCLKTCTSEDDCGEGEVTCRAVQDGGVAHCVNTNSIE